MKTITTVLDRRTRHHLTQDEQYQRFYAVVADMTARGKSGSEIAAVVGYSVKWVSRFRIRHRIPIPTACGRPRNGALMHPEPVRKARPGVKQPRVFDLIDTEEL